MPILLALPVLFLSSYLTSENVPPLMVQIISFFIMAIPNILVVEGGDVMLYLGLLFYIFRRHRIAQMVILALVSICVSDRSNVCTMDDGCCDYSNVFLQW